MPDYFQVDQPPLPETRKRECHKGEFGHTLIIAGSRRMMGTAILCSTAATRVGSGLVTLACPESVQPHIAAAWPPAMTLPLKETPDGSIALGAWPQVEEFLAKATVVAAGPGLGRNRSTELFVQRLIERVRLPLVLDADALNALAADMDLMQRHKTHLTLTPHPGEMARLTGKTVAEIQQDRRAAAYRFAAQFACTVVLKGAGTVVSCEGQLYVNATGTPYMATGGAGDVLTGMIAGLLAQKISAFEAARTAVYWHGLAADRAPNSNGPGAVAPTDLIAQLHRSAHDLDWYNEELRLEGDQIYDPDAEDNGAKEPNW